MQAELPLAPTAWMVEVDENREDLTQEGAFDTFKDVREPFR